MPQSRKVQIMRSQWLYTRCASRTSIGTVGDSSRRSKTAVCSSDQLIHILLKASVQIYEWCVYIFVLSGNSHTYANYLQSAAAHSTGWLPQLLRPRYDHAGPCRRHCFLYGRRLPSVYHLVFDSIYVKALDYWRLACHTCFCGRSKRS